jgi:triosephosphate isomerase (TIM)
MARRKLVAGNWKMNGLAASAAMLDELAAAVPAPPCDVLVCPPATLVARLAGGAFSVGGQDCHPEPSGAHTGDIAAEMLKDAGAVAVIVGHSERRADHGEDDALVARKAAAAWRACLLAIVCVGETEAERDAGTTLDRIGTQLAGSLPEASETDRLVVAYEPVWAIGTGRTPSVKEVAEVHAFMREWLTRRFGAEAGGAIRLLYGGSVKPGNAAEIFAVADVDGALVGGASLTAADFAGIIAAAG